MSERKVKTLYWARIPQFDLSNCAELGASLEQRTHKTVMLQSHFVIRHSVRDDEGLRSSHRYEQLPQRHKPIAFDAEGLRLALCFAFSCGIQVEPVYARVGQRVVNKGPAGVRISAPTNQPRP